jgi:hypothetical protein
MTFPDVPPSVVDELPGIENRQELIPLAAVTSVDTLTTTADPNKGTELGGVGGPIQPPPHVPTGIERLHQIYAIDPSDPGTEPGSIVAPELEGDFTTGYNRD